MRTAHGVATVVVTAAAIAATVFLAEPLIKAFEFRGMLAEKQGRVIDADTGQGIPDVTVTVIWESGTYNTGWASSSGGCDLERVATTDAIGGYTIPAVYGQIKFERIWWKQLLMRLLGMTPFGVGYGWHLVTFKPGYVRVGDENHFPAAVAADHQPDRSFPAYWNAPDYEMDFDHAQIGPIALRRRLLSPAEQVIYDDALLMRSICHGYPKVRETTMKASVRMLPCSMPEAEILDRKFIHAYAWISVDGNWLSERKNWTAGTLCQAIGGPE